MASANAATRGEFSSLSAEVRKTLFNTFVTVGVMLALTGIAAYFSLGLQLSLGIVLALFAVSIVAIIATHKLRKSPYGLVMLAAFAALQGVCLGPTLNHYLKMQGGTGVVATAAGLTALAVFACAAYVIVSKRNFTRWGGFLFGATLMLIVAMIVGMFFPTPFLHVALSAVTALLFMAWMLHDVSSIIHGQETSYITAALSIYLDVLNIFVSLLRLVGLIPGD